MICLSNHRWRGAGAFFTKCEQAAERSPANAVYIVAMPQSGPKPSAIAPSDLPRRLGLVDSLAIVVGVTIGGGIFLVPNLVAQTLKSPGAIVAVWAFAGVISFFGALACAELGCAIPATGGQYVYLREAYGPMVGFLCGWSMFTVARTAQVAWLAVTLAMYFSYFVPLSPIQSKLLGIGAIVLFTAVNYRGVTAAAIVQRIFTFAKVAGLLVIIVSAFLWAGKVGSNTVAIGQTLSTQLSSFGVALIACVLAYDGWVQLVFVAGKSASLSAMCCLRWHSDR